MARKKRRPLTDEEISKQSGTELPRREALSLVFANLPVPANLAGAPSPVASQSAGASNAEQATPVEQ